MNSNETLFIPRSEEIERIVLSSMLASEQIYQNFIADITPGMFYHTGRKEIFAYMQDKNCCDPVILAEGLPALREEISEVLNSQTNLDLSACIEILRDKMNRRKLFEIGSSLANEAATNFDDPYRAIADRASGEIMSLDDKTKSDPEPIKTILSRVMKELDNNRTGVSVCKTGLADVDSKIGGFLPGELVIIAARPGMGKSSFALNIVRHNAVEKGLPILVFTMEMNKTLTGGRLLFAEANESYDAALRGLLGKNNWANVGMAANNIMDCPIIIDDSPIIGLAQIISKSIKTKNKYGLAAVIVDHLQLLSIDSKGRSRNEEMATVSCGLKSLARSLDIPVIALSQLSRQCESRQKPIPMLSDLRDSGALEQDADRVIFLYRDEVYNNETEERGVAHIIAAKNRNGQTGDVKVAWDGKTMSFKNLVKDRDESMRGFEPARCGAVDD